jgi:hypothetical protein
MRSVHRWACRRIVGYSASQKMTYLNLGYKFVTLGEHRTLLGLREIFLTSRHSAKK